MNSNVIKIIACVSMLIDHIGFFLFPDIVVFRYIGRLAMPIFSFCIAQGCIHTRSRIKYFLRVFVAGVLCQAVYITDSILYPSDDPVYINIMLVFAISIAMCCTFIDIKNALTHNDKKATTINLFKLDIIIIFIIALDIFCKYSCDLLGTSYIIDYGVTGIILPLFAVISTHKYKSVTLFALGLVIYCLISYQQIPFVWWCLLSIPLLYIYNGKKGKLNLKYLFYIFYPAHIAVLYIISIL